MERAPTYDHVFLVGPGGSGKSTLAPVLAPLLDARSMDLDHEFTCRFGAPPDVIAAHGYGEYCRCNSALAVELVGAATDRIVLATSSGFLAHDDQPAVVDENGALVRRSGRSVLVVPDEDDAGAADIIATRQATRYRDDASIDRWREVTLARLPAYRAAADIIVVSRAPAHELALEVMRTFDR